MIFWCFNSESHMTCSKCLFTMPFTKLEWFMLLIFNGMLYVYIHLCETNVDMYYIYVYILQI